MKTRLDATDTEILAERMEKFDEGEGPRIGDFVLFPDGTYLRLAIHLYGSLYQVNRGDSYYLGKGHVDGSGAMFTPPISLGDLEATEETRLGWVWFFSHDQRRAHNGVEARATFRVYRHPGPVPN